MKNAFISLIAFGSLIAPIASQASSRYQICKDKTGTVIVENGNVTIKGGIGDVGPALSQTVIKTISEKHQSCVDGANYISTYVTLEKVVYALEENVTDSAIVRCTKTITGIVPPGTKCN